MKTTQKMIDYYERRSRLKRRSPNPTFELMQKIAAALEISVTKLLGEEAVTVRSASKT
jgi:transcriptional regulator with XRE-family HTH domain